MTKKIFKILFKILLAIIVLILLVLLIARKMFPPEKIKSIAIANAESALNRKVIADDVWMNPFKGVQIDNVVIFEKASTENFVSDSSWFVKVKRVQLRYSLLSLLRKELRINKILIDNPMVNLKQGDDFKWNFDDLILPDTTKTETTLSNAVSDTLTEEFSLPVTISVKELTVRDIAANIQISQANTSLMIKSGGLTLKLSDMYLPRKNIDLIKEKAQGKIEASSNQVPWQIEINSHIPDQKIEISSLLNLVLECNARGGSSITGKAELALENVRLTTGDKESDNYENNVYPLPRLVSVAFSLNGDINRETIQINQLKAKIGNETIFNILGTISDFLQQPKVNLEIVESKIRAHELISSFLPLLPDSIKNELDKLSIQGDVTLNGSKFSGSPLSQKIGDMLQFDLILGIKNLTGSFAEPLTHFYNLNLTVNGHGVLSPNGISNTTASVTMGIDSVTTQLDTLNFTFKKIWSEITGELNEDMFPRFVNTTIDIEDFFEVPLKFTANFKSDDKFNKYDATANLTVDKLSLASLLPTGIEGAIDFNLSLVSSSLDSIIAGLNIATDIIEIETEEEPIIVYPVDVTCDMALSTDTSFQKINLNNFNMDIGDFAELVLKGSFELDPSQTIQIQMEELNIDHERILDAVPEQFLEDIEGLTVKGSTRVFSTLEVLLPGDGEPVLRAKGSVNTKAVVNYPEQFLNLGYFSSDINFETDGLSAKANVSAKLDSLLMPEIQDEPFNNISINLAATLPDFETVKIDSGEVLAPDLKTRIFVNGHVDSLTGDLRANARFALLTDAVEDTIKFLNDMMLTGKISQSANVELQGNILHASGNMEVKNLYFVLGDLVKVDSVNGKIHFTEKIDIDSGSLLESKQQEPGLSKAHSFYYDLLRPYYQHSDDQFSHLYIRRVQAMDYIVEHVNLDIIIKNERIEIPKFYLNLYDGNMSGFISVNLKDGTPEKMEWQVKANLSRMNSAKLLQSQKQKLEGSNLNMNMELIGKGVDPAGDFDLEGSVYVTKIGPKFADNILRSLDPKRTDKSIQDTRKLLNWGYKPKLVSCEIKHDNLYPSIHLVKGNLITKLIPLNLSGGKIELARIPIKFFLTSQATESQ